MKAYRYLALLSLPVFLAACTVEEERGTDDQLKTESQAKKPKSAPSTKDSKASPVEESLGGIASGSSGMSDFEREQLKNQKAAEEAAQKRHEELLADRERDRESKRQQSEQAAAASAQIREDNKLMMMLMMSLSGAIAQKTFDDPSARSVLDTEEDDEDCEQTAVGTQDAWSNHNKLLQEAAKRFGLNEGAESVDFRSGNSASPAAELPADVGEEADAPAADTAAGAGNPEPSPEAEASRAADESLGEGVWPGVPYAAEVRVFNATREMLNEANQEWHPPMAAPAPQNTSSETNSNDENS